MQTGENEQGRRKITDPMRMIVGGRHLFWFGL